MANDNHFSLTLDTLAPSGSITRPAEYVNAQTTCTITKGDATYMCAWFDTNATGTLPASPNWVAATTSVTSSFDANGVYYGHVCLMDDVNNKSAVYNTQSITYDVTPPTVSNVSLADGALITKTRAITIDFDFDDNLSGCVSCAISGDINAEATQWSATLTSEEISAKHVKRNIVLSGEGEQDVTKTVSVTVTDASGNTSTAGSDSIILDTEFLKGDIVLMQGTRKINGQWTNESAVTVNLELTEGTEKDLVAYKIYGGGLADGDDDWVEVTKGTEVSVVKHFTESDSDNKVVKASVKDDAGNVTDLADTFAKVDYTEPTNVTVTIKSPETQYVSKVAGFTTKDLVLTADASISGLASWSLKMNGTQYPGALGTDTLAEEVQISSANMSGDGEAVEYTFTLTVVDNAGNTATSEGCVVILDTVAPKNGSITMPAWLNRDDADHTTYPAYSGAGATASVEDAGAGMGTMQCWVSSTAEDTTPAGTAVAYAANPTHAQINWDGHAESASNYLHIKYVDAVGNAKIYHSSAFGIDTVVPADGAVAFTEDAYPSTTAAVKLTFSDATSGVEKFKIWGDITAAATESAAQWQDVVESDFSVTLTTGDGMKNVYVKYKDVAGNYSVNAVTDEAELDTTTPTGTITLLDTDESKSVDPIRNIADFVAHIAYSDDELGGVQYKIYGDFTFDEQKAQGITEAAAEWNNFVYDSGVQYKKIANMYCTSGDGTKTVYIKVKDNAGNVSDPISASFEYDTTAPEVVVSGVDYNRISKVYELRRNSEGTIAGKYADETNFVFTPDSKIQAYKVCAYLNQAAAEGGSHEDAAIPTTAGSVNMSATGLSSEAAVNAKIKGADYETALGGAGNDGAHFVVVYVQDLGGTWSQNAIFTI